MIAYVTQEGDILLKRLEARHATDEEIVAAVRAAEPHSDFEYACYLSRGYWMREFDDGLPPQRWRPFMDKELDDLVNKLAYLRRYEGRHDAIDWEIARVEAALAKHYEDPRTKKEKRAEVAARYAELFEHLVRRDGEHCGACGEVEQLQIDHVIPLSRGGSNHPDNLQLLCGPCNLAKGTDTTDYRNEQ